MCPFPHVLYVLWAWRTQLVSQFPDKCSCLLDCGFVFARVWQCCQCCMAGYNLTGLRNNRLLFFHTKWLCGLLCVCVFNNDLPECKQNYCKVLQMGQKLFDSGLLWADLSSFRRPYVLSPFFLNPWLKQCGGATFLRPSSQKRFTYPTDPMLQAVQNSKFQFIIVTLSFLGRHQRHFQGI